MTGKDPKSLIRKDSSAIALRQSKNLLTTTRVILAQSAGRDISRLLALEIDRKDTDWNNYPYKKHPKITYLPPEIRPTA